jgi:hypothetical protein
MIHTRRLTAARKTEDAWEAGKVAPLREFITDTIQAGVSLDAVKADLRKILSKWPTKNKTKRGFLVWGVTKSMRSRARRQLNEITVAD